jgi:hypothetical protein
MTTTPTPPYKVADENADSCAHRYLTSHGRGWECARCGVGILSLSVPLPMPLVAKALAAIASNPEKETR